MSLAKVSKILLVVFVSVFLMVLCACQTEESSTDGQGTGGNNEWPVYKLYGLNFSPYMGDQDPNLGVQISEEQIYERMGIIADYTNWIRTFGSTHGLEAAGFIGHNLGLKVAMGAWLDSDTYTNLQEIDNLVTYAGLGDADLLIVGSEVLLRGDMTEDELISYIESVKQRTVGIPVTYADTYSELLRHPRIIDAVDVVLVNYYPYWEGVSVDLAVAQIHQWHKEILELAKGKKVIVSETGWPSAGDVKRNAVPSLENASFFFLNFVSWARANNVEYFYFEAFDEPWKAKYEGPQGAHWGIWYENGEMKPGMERVFNGETMEDNWSNPPIPGGPGEPDIEITHVPNKEDVNDRDLVGQVWHVNPGDYRVAVYIYVNGGWWTKPYWDFPLTLIRIDGSWVCNVVTGGSDRSATKFAAFLVPKGYQPPLGRGEPTLPAELEENAVAWTEVERP